MSEAPGRYGVAVPQADPTTADPGALTVRFARAAEAAGLDSLWVQEQLIGRDPSYEPVLHLAFVAAVTSSVRLGTAVVVAPVRNPLVLAKQLGSLDQLSGGRLTVGVGLGDMKLLFAASGVPLTTRARRLERFLDVAEAAWRDSRIDHAAGELPMTPASAQRPHPPIWFAGRSAAALERARRRGTGWIGAGGSSTADFAALVRHLREAGTPPGFTVAKKVYLAVDDDAGRAWDGLLDWFERHWGGPSGRVLGRSVAVAGSPDDVARGLADVRRAGADLVILNPVHDEERQLGLLVDEVLPRADELAAAAAPGHPDTAPGHTPDSGEPR